MNLKLIAWRYQTSWISHTILNVGYMFFYESQTYCMEISDQLSQPNNPECRVHVIVNLKLIKWRYQTSWVSHTILNAKPSAICIVPNKVSWLLWLNACACGTATVGMCGTRTPYGSGFSVVTSLTPCFLLMTICTPPISELLPSYKKLENCSWNPVSSSSPSSL